MNGKGLLIAIAFGLAALVAGSAPSFAQAHEHGVAEIGIALDGRNAQIELTAPGSAIIGFEHEAKSAADKKQMADAYAKFKASTAAMFVFEPALGCTAKTLQIGVPEEHEHGEDSHSHDAGKPEDHAHGHLDVRALVDVKCTAPLKGSTLRFALRTQFPDLETLRVQVVGEDFQTGAELKGNRNSIRLAK